MSQFNQTMLFWGKRNKAEKGCETNGLKINRISQAALLSVAARLNKNKRVLSNESVACHVLQWL